MATRKRPFALAILLLGGLSGFSCRPGERAVPSVINAKPRFGSYARLEPLPAIDVSGIDMFGRESAADFDRVIAFDSRDFLYILDTYASRISVFDENGRFIRAFGRPGQGPEEFTRPHLMVIKDDRIYVFEGFTGLKILSLDGAYLSKRVVNIENLLMVRAAAGSFFLFRGRTDATFTKLTFLMSKEGEDLSGGPQLFECDYPPGLNGPNYNFAWHNWMLIGSDGKFFFPEDNFGRYLITRYDAAGRPELRFGRPYEVGEYTKKARDRFEALYRKWIQTKEMRFPSSPPVVRNMFQDEKGNIWVIAGESSEDNGDPAFKNTIDIFSRKGEWLSSMKSGALSRFCHYHKSRIYKIPLPDADPPDQTIEVFRIRYLDPH
jgi:hypothetical protein